MGGLSKKAWQLEKLRQAGETPHLTLDAGALLFKNPQLAPGSASQEKITAAGIVESYNLMGYHAVGVSGRDLSGGLDFLRQLEKISRFSWLSANLVWSENQLPVFKGSMVIPVGTSKVGVAALTNPASALPQLAGTGAVILPWREALVKELAKLSGQADFIVLLSNLDEAANQSIAKEFELHLIIPADGVGGNFAPRQSGNTLLTQSGPQGKYLGQLVIDWQPAHRWGSNLGEELARRKSLHAHTAEQLESYRREKGLLAPGAEPPGDSIPYQKMVASEVQLRAEVQALQEQLDGAANNPAPSTYSSDFFPIQAAMPDQPEVARLVQQLQREVNRLGSSPAAAEGESNYLGSQACFACHPQQEKSWSKSRHARAYQTLVRRQEENNLNCLPCHLTGVASAFAPSALALPPERRNVGCENCHGPGRAHAAAPSQNRLQPQPPAETCLACHTPDHDHNFSYEQKKKKMGCRSRPI